MKTLETETGKINTHSLIEKHHVPQLNSVEKTEIWSLYFSKWKHAITTLTFLMKMEILWRDNLFFFKNLCVWQALFVLLLLYILYIKNVFLEANGNDQSRSPRKQYKQARKIAITQSWAAKTTIQRVVSLCHPPPLTTESYTKHQPSSLNSALHMVWSVRSSPRWSETFIVLLLVALVAPTVLMTRQNDHGCSESSKTCASLFHLSATSLFWQPRLPVVMKLSHHVPRNPGRRLYVKLLLLVWIRMASIG